MVRNRMIGTWNFLYGWPTLIPTGVRNARSPIPSGGEMTGRIGRPFVLLLSMALTGTAFGDVLLTAEYKGHRYHLLDPKEWTEQNKEAQSHGWYLVAIGDKEENDFLRATFAGPRGNVWIGLSDANSEGHFAWT